MFALLLLPLLLQRLLPSYSHGGGGSLLGRREGKGGWVSECAHDDFRRLLLLEKYIPYAQTVLR